MGESHHMAHLRLAKDVSLQSDDPSTKVGAILIAPERVQGEGFFTRTFCGFNHIPLVAPTDPIWQDRTLKYECVVHAEVDALRRAGSRAKGGSLYVTHPPCCRCASVAASAGIHTLVIGDSLLEKSEDERERFLRTCKWDLSQEILRRGRIYVLSLLDE